MPESKDPENVAGPHVASRHFLKTRPEEPAKAVMCEDMYHGTSLLLP